MTSKRNVIFLRVRQEMIEIKKLELPHFSANSQRVIDFAIKLMALVSLFALR